MLEIRPEELKGSLVTDRDYDEDSGELIKLWVRLPDKRLVVINSINFKFCLSSCPLDEEEHGGKYVWMNTYPSDLIVPPDALLTGAIITDVSVISDEYFTYASTIWMRLIDKRFVMINATPKTLAIGECSKLLEQKHGDVKTTGDFIRSRIQTPGDLIDVLIHDAKEWTKNGSVNSINRNKHMNNCNGLLLPISQDVVDASIVDFINYVGAQYCMDVGFYTQDLYRKRDD
ncbi:MAG: hypothetical protein EHM34_04910 [Nitrosopumilales archaeon]|nr:MAG: hypothetical protein EHM34_04910 [Nitrosopumilales archaeon]